MESRMIVVQGAAAIPVERPGVIALSACGTLLAVALGRL